MDGLAGAGIINWIYFFLFFLGVGYALVVAVLGGLAHIGPIDIDIPGVDLHPGEPDIHLELPFRPDVSHDVDHPEVGLSPLSPIVIATFITTFGGVGGIVNSLFPISPVFGLLIATVSGLGLSSLMFLLYTRVLMGAQGSSEIKTGDLVGQTAEATTPIPANQIGEVTLVVRGTRTRFPARAVDGQAITRGTLVDIVEEMGNIVIVRAKTAPADE